jgi:hypothetical protein
LAALPRLQLAGCRPFFYRFPLRAIASSISSSEATIARSILFAQAANVFDLSPSGSSFSTAKTKQVKGVACGFFDRSPPVVRLMPIPCAISATSRIKPEYQARAVGPLMLL